MIIQLKKSEVKLPDFIIIGAARSGTTFLFHYLRQHPQVFMPDNKEPCFFSFMGNSRTFEDPNLKKQYIRKKDDYIRLFKLAKDDQIIGEGSTTYLYTFKDTIKNIKRVYGSHLKNLKIIALLRNPAERAYSHYLHFIRRKNEPYSFLESLKPEIIKKRIPINPSYDYIGYGLYYEPIKAFKEEFPLFKVYLFEEIKERDSFLSDVCLFLGIDQKVPIDTNFLSNPSGLPKNKVSEIILKMISRDSAIKRSFNKLFPKNYSIKHKLILKLLRRTRLNESVKKILIGDYFKKNIKKLQILINRDLSSWLG